MTGYLEDSLASVRNSIATVRVPHWVSHYDEIQPVPATPETPVDAARDAALVWAKESTQDRVVRLLASAPSGSTVVIAAPYMQPAALEGLLTHVAEDVRVQVFTSWELRDLAKGIGSTRVFDIVEKHGGELFIGRAANHAKVFKIPNHALAGSANVTEAALTRNNEIVLDVTPGHENWLHIEDAVDRWAAYSQRADRALVDQVHQRVQAWQALDSLGLSDEQRAVLKQHNDALPIAPAPTIRPTTAVVTRAPAAAPARMKPVAPSHPKAAAAKPVHDEAALVPDHELADNEVATLRPHQQAAFDAVLDAWTDGARGHQRTCVVMPTGTGKTVLAASLLAEHLSDETHRTLIVAPTKEILEQFESRLGTELRALGLDRSFGHAYDGKAQWSKNVVFATYDAVRNKQDFTAFDTVVYDEAHHLPAPGNLEAFERLMQHEPAVLALTATPNRLDDRDDEVQLFAALGLDAPSYEYALEDALADGNLAAIDYRIFTDVMTPEWRENVYEPLRAGNAGPLAEREEQAFDLEEVGPVILEHMERADGSTKPTVVFAKSIGEAKQLAAIMGRDFRAVWGKSETRDEDIRAFRAGEIKGLVAYNVLNEGIDLPEVELLVSLRETASPIVYLQQLGRGLRKAPGKDTVTVLDFTHSIERIAAVQTLATSIHERCHEPSRNTENTRAPMQVTLDGTPLGEGHTADFDEILRTIRLATTHPTITTIEDAITGLYTWAQLPKYEGGLGLTEEELTTWYPTRRQITTASSKGRTWSCQKWEHETGNNGMAGIRKALGLHVEPRAVINTIVEAKAGLYEWAQLPKSKGGLGLTQEQLTTWYPTFSNIRTASSKGRTWSYDTWVKNTGNEGMAGIRKALGLHVEPRAVINTIVEAKAGLYEWAQLPKSKGGLGLTQEQLTTWYPTRRQITTASSKGRTWSCQKWEHETGNNGMAGIHKALGLETRAVINAIEEAKAGLYEWALRPKHKGGLGLTQDQLTTWHPTQKQIDTASKHRYTWSCSTWERNTGNKGITGIHKALGLHVEPRAAINTLADAITGLHTWAQRDKTDGGLGLTEEELTTWYPTHRDIVTASKHRYTWSPKTWERNTGNNGMDGIRDAIRSHREATAITAFMQRFGLAMPATTPAPAGPDLGR